MRPIKKAFLVDLLAFFFRAMLKGYAASGPKATVPELPGSKCFVFEDGLWKLVDVYVVGENGKSAGWTIIFYDGTAVWQMSYSGWYQDDAIPFLKAALRLNYADGFFKGGRGPEIFSDGPFEYRNYPNGTFEQFDGFETVSSKILGTAMMKTSHGIGTHAYRGGLLV